MNEHYSLIIAESTHDYAAAVGLFKEYADSLDFGLSFQKFDDELKDLKAQYYKPSGSLILIRFSNEFIGCAGIRENGRSIGELKRMYIRPAHRGKGLAHELMAKSVEIATELGYERLRLDTIDTMAAAIHVYRSFGFYDIGPYRFNPMKNVVYMEKDLLSPKEGGGSLV